LLTPVGLLGRRSRRASQTRARSAQSPGVIGLSEAIRRLFAPGCAVSFAQDPPGRPLLRAIAPELPQPRDLLRRQLPRAERYLVQAGRRSVGLDGEGYATAPNRRSLEAALHRPAPRSGIPRHLCVALLLCAGGVSCADGQARDYATFVGVARGEGQVPLSPRRGFDFDSPGYSYIAFAQTSAALPRAYRITIPVESVDIEHSGCRFGIFEEAARLGGDNATINALCKYAVVFQEIKGQRPIYLWYFTPEGGYLCYNGTRWVEDAWVPTGATWEPGLAYRVTLGKGPEGYLSRVLQGDKELLAPPAVDAAAVRGAASGDYLAFGDMVNDFVKGKIKIGPVTIEESQMRPYLEHDMEHVVIRQAPPGRYAMYGGLTLLPDGEVFCVYKVGSLDDKGSPWTVRDEVIVCAKSERKGRHWPPLEDYIYDNPKTRQENCCGKGYMNRAGVLRHPFYILNADYEEQAQEQNWSRLHLAVTRDGGGTWDTPQIETPFCIAASFGGLLRLKSGEVLLGAYGAVERGSFRHQAGVLSSRDDGETWSDYRVIGAHADPDGGPARLNETDIAQLADGRLVAMSRTQYDGFPLYRSVSEDDGRIWTTAPGGLTGLCPALWYSPAGPPEGTLVLAYHDRWGVHASCGGVYVAFSHDGGATWGEPLWISGGAYPCMIALADGSIFCSYYADNTLLRADIFSIPFPTGLRVDSATGVKTVKWDAYTGERTGAYRYRVYRAAEPPVEPTPEHLVGEATACKYEDASAHPGRVYHYRVVALEGDREVGRSWLAAG